MVYLKKYIHYLTKHIKKNIYAFLIYKNDWLHCSELYRQLENEEEL